MMNIINRTHIFFYIKNFLYWFRLNKINRNQGVIFVEFNNNSFMNFSVSILASFVSNEKRCNKVYYVTQKLEKIPLLDRLIIKSFGFAKFIFLYNFIEKQGRPLYEKYKFELNRIKTIEDLYGYSYNGVYFGDLLYDLVLRSNSHKCNVREINDDINDPLYYLVTTVNFIDEYIKSKKIISSVFSHSTMLGGMIQRYLLLKYSVKGFTGSIHSSICKINEMENDRNPFVGSLNDNMLNKIINNVEQYNIQLQLANNYLEKRFSGLAKQFDARIAFLDTNILYKTKEDFNRRFNLNQNYPNVFICLHVFTDQPNTFKSFFYDYFLWMKNTIEIVKRINNINWIIKEHPSTCYYPINDLNTKDYVNSLINGLDNIVYLDTSSAFHNSSLINVADYIVTSSGSIALEMACFGIPSLICSESFYCKLNIVCQAKNYDEYKHYLENIHLLKRLDPKMVDKAKISFYLTHGVLWENTWNNDVFFPSISFEERREPNISSLIDYYLKFIGSNESKIFNNQMIKFIQNDKSNIFFRDPELAKLEEN